MSGFSAEFDDDFVNRLASRVAAQAAVLLKDELNSPWMNRDEAVAYSRLKGGTFDEYVQKGHIRNHGGRSKLYHRDELDADLRALNTALSKPQIRRAA